MTAPGPVQLNKPPHLQRALGRAWPSCSPTAPGHVFADDGFVLTPIRSARAPRAPTTAIAVSARSPRPGSVAPGSSIQAGETAAVAQPRPVASPTPPSATVASRPRRPARPIRNGDRHLALPPDGRIVAVGRLAAAGRGFAQAPAGHHRQGPFVYTGTRRASWPVPVPSPTASSSRTLAGRHRDQPLTTNRSRTVDSVPAFIGDARPRPGASAWRSPPRTGPSPGDRLDLRHADPAAAAALHPAGLLARPSGGAAPLTVDIGNLWGHAWAIAMQPDRAFCWWSAAAGLPTTSPATRPILMIGRVIRVDAGTVWTWGSSTMGQLARSPRPRTATLRCRSPAWPGGSRCGRRLSQPRPRRRHGVRPGDELSFGQLGDGPRSSGATGPVPRLTGVVAVFPPEVCTASACVATAPSGPGVRRVRPARRRDLVDAPRAGPVPALEGVDTISTGLCRGFASATMVRRWPGAARRRPARRRHDHRQHSPRGCTLMPADYGFHQLSAGGLHRLAVG